MSSDEGESESEAKKEDEGEPAAEAAGPVVPSVNDMMENAKEADFLARAQASSVVGPAMQPEEERKEEMLKAKELEPKTNPWASGAFKRGLALQVCVHDLVGSMLYHTDVHVMGFESTGAWLVAGKRGACPGEWGSVQFLACCVV